VQADFKSVESSVKHILHHKGIFQDVAHFSDVSDSFRTISNSDPKGFFCCDGACREIEMVAMQWPLAMRF